MLIERNPDHIYTVNGVVKPSVHEILTACNIIDTKFIHEFDLEKGEYVHKACSLHDDSMLDMDTLDNRLVPYVNAWAKFKADTGCKIISKDQFIFIEDMDYCGEYDRLLELNGQNVLLELKSNNVPWWTGIQLGAYAMHWERPVQLRALILSKEGQYKISVPFSYNQVLRAWRSCVHVYQMQKGRKIS